MSQMSRYESRTGNLSCKPEEVFGFVTDIRNFRQFVPEGTINDLEIAKDSCSFNISPLGNIKMNLSESEPNTSVVFNGTVFGMNDFSLILTIKENLAGNAEVVVKLAASFNPFLKMMADPHINRFLGTLIDEMEKFRGWKNATI